MTPQKSAVSLKVIDSVKFSFIYFIALRAVAIATLFFYVAMLLPFLRTAAIIALIRIVI